MFRICSVFPLCFHVIEIGTLLKAFRRTLRLQIKSNPITAAAGKGQAHAPPSVSFASVPPRGGRRRLRGKGTPERRPCAVEPPSQLVTCRGENDGAHVMSSVKWGVGGEIVSCILGSLSTVCSHENLRRVLTFIHLIAAKSDG